jgi:hypothetical protein
VEAEYVGFFFATGFRVVAVLLAEDFLVVRV